MKPDDFSGCLRLDGDVVSDVEFDWYGSDELIDGWFELGEEGARYVFVSHSMASCKRDDGELRTYAHLN